MSALTLKPRTIKQRFALATFRTLKALRVWKFRFAQGLALWSVFLMCDAFPEFLEYVLEQPPDSPLGKQIWRPHWHKGSLEYQQMLAAKKAGRLAYAAFWAEMLQKQKGGAHADP